MKAPELARVRKAARRRELAELEYRQAVKAAAQLGHSQARIGAAAGVSRQAVAKTIARTVDDPG